MAGMTFKSTASRGGRLAPSNSFTVGKTKAPRWCAGPCTLLCRVMPSMLQDVAHGRSRLASRRPEQTGVLGQTPPPRCDVLDVVLEQALAGDVQVHAQEPCGQLRHQFLVCIRVAGPSVSGDADPVEPGLVAGPVARLVEHGAPVVGQRVERSGDGHLHAVLAGGVVRAVTTVVEVQAQRVDDARRRLEPNLRVNVRDGHRLDGVGGLLVVEDVGRSPAGEGPLGRLDDGVAVPAGLALADGHPAGSALHLREEDGGALLVLPDGVPRLPPLTEASPAVIATVGHRGEGKSEVVEAATVRSARDVVRRLARVAHPRLLPLATLIRRLNSRQEPLDGGFLSFANTSTHCDLQG